MRRLVAHNFLTLDGVAVPDAVIDTIASDQPFADHINSVPKYVVSTTLERAPWGTGADATLISGDVVDEIAHLKQETGGPIGLHGSPTLVESLVHEDLIDELRLEIFPVVAGRGARLFRDGAASKRLRLLASQTTSNGVIIASYGPTSD